jgi:hypothetical protein
LDTQKERVEESTRAFVPLPMPQEGICPTYSLQR